MFNYVLFIPDSIHVSIHYPEGNKRPEIYVSEEEKGEMAKDVKTIQDPDIPTERSSPLHNPETIDSLFHDGTVDGVALSSVPHTEYYHMTKSKERLVEAHHNQVINPQGSSPVGLKSSRQDDPRAHRIHKKKHLKETYWNHKNTPPIRRPVPVSSQNYDIREVKAYQLPYQPEGIEYRDGAFAKARLPPHKSGTCYLNCHKPVMQVTATFRIFKHLLVAR